MVYMSMVGWSREDLLSRFRLLELSGLRRRESAMIAAPLMRRFGDGVEDECCFVWGCDTISSYHQKPLSTPGQPSTSTVIENRPGVGAVFQLDQA